MAKSRSLCFIYSITISGDSASYFLEMFVINSLGNTLPQTRMGEDRITLPRKGPIRDKYIFLVPKSPAFDRF